MRILVLNYEFPPVGGGGGRASEELVMELVHRGHEVRVITSKALDLPRAEERAGYRIHRVATGRRSLYNATFSSMARYVLSGIVPGFRLIRSWRPDIIHAHFAVPTGALAYVLSRPTGKPYVLTVHLGDVPGGVPEKTDRWFQIVGPFTQPIWTHASNVLAVSEYTRDLAYRRYSVPIEVIPNGLSLPPEPDYKVEKPIRLIFAGRFQPQKNLPFLIDALSAIDDLDWSCSLIGDGPDMDAVKRRIRAAGLEARIDLPGWVDERQVGAELGTSDVLVMPSLAEGLPVVGVQALAYGVAIVASDAGGLGELVLEKQNGRRIEVGDLDGFIEALRWTLSDAKRLESMKRKSRAMAAEYGIGRVAQEYEAVFESATRIHALSAASES